MAATTQRTIRLDVETRQGAPDLHYWTCEDCAAYGPYRGGVDRDDVIEAGTVHAKVCADDRDVQITVTTPTA